MVSKDNKICKNSICKNLHLDGPRIFYVQKGTKIFSIFRKWTLNNNTNFKQSTLQNLTDW